MLVGYISQFLYLTNFSFYKLHTFDFYLSGIFRPVEVIPHPFRDMIYYLFPTASTVPSFRFAMNRGASITHSQVWPGILITMGWGLFFALLCPVLLRYNKSKL